MLVSVGDFVVGAARKRRRGDAPLFEAIDTSNVADYAGLWRVRSESDPSPSRERESEREEGEREGDSCRSLQRETFPSPPRGREKRERLLATRAGTCCSPSCPDSDGERPRSFFFDFFSFLCFIFLLFFHLFFLVCLERATAGTWLGLPSVDRCVSAESAGRLARSCSHSTW